MSPACEMELERDGSESAPCGQRAEWVVKVAVNNGSLATAVYRCEEHILDTVAFHLDEESTTAVFISEVGQ